MDIRRQAATAYYAVACQSSFSLGQIAAQSGLGKTLMHHHLTVLRSAGLILVRSGNPAVYTLRYGTLAQVGPLLETVLAPPLRKDPTDGAAP